MKIAITVWGNRISPVFDSAQNLLVVDVDDDQIYERKLLSFRSGLLAQFISLLEEMEVQVLICGALCKGPVNALESRGIKVLPFMTGKVDTVLDVFVRGEDLSDCFMPGCGSARCCRTQVGINKKNPESS